jgi:HK97 family phage major capsid protein/HK97 family phage prohead protease
MEACMHVVSGEAESHEQAVAICMDTWRRSKRKKKDGEGIMMNRAYSMLEVRTVNEDRRIIKGVATTPTPDRLGDIVEPLGVQFKNPLPLLLYHQHDKPVGQVRFDNPTNKGITFEAMIPKISDAGPLRDRVEEAWQSIKAGLLAGLSIGFRTIEKSMMKEGGFRFLKSEVLELSLVCVPANSDCSIQVIRSLDQAASGQTSTSGVTEKHVTQRTTAMKSISEQISALEASRQAKSARMEDIMQKAMGDDRAPDDAETEEFDELEDEVKDIDGSLRRLRSVEKLRQEKAEPIDEKKNGKAKSHYGQYGQFSREATPEPGVQFARIVRVKAMSWLTHRDPISIAEKMYAHDRVVVDTVKADVIGGTTDGPTWASPLIQQDGPFADFVEFLRPLTIIGRIPGLRRVPFRVGLVGQTSGGQGYWVGESQPKPLTKFDFNRRTLTPLKVANIAVLSEELVRDSSPSADTIVRDQLAAALQARLDEDFIDPTQAAVADVSPASILNGITAIGSTGNAIASIRADILAIVGAFVADNNPPTSGVWIMRSLSALGLSLLQNPLGQPEFPTVNINGGTLFGMPIVTSQHVPDGTVALINAGDIYIADEGGVNVDVSREASLEMEDAPANTPNALGASPQTVSHQAMVSMWQTNNVAFRAERTINWMRRRDEGVQHLSSVDWGEAGSP